MKRWLRSVLGAGVVLALCLGGYLPSGGTAAGGDHAVGVKTEEAQGLVWKDAETGQILFTMGDVLAFDWDDQVFFLDVDAALDFRAWMVPHKYQSRELLVEDEQGLIYRGRWVNWVSSIAFKGPVYNPLGWAPTQLFCIDNGYPGTLPPGADDARFAPRLRTALESKGVLWDYDPNEPYTSLKIDCIGVDWHTCGEDLKIRVEYFPHTFSTDRDARAHIYFAGGEVTCSEIDSLTAEVKFVANRGQYRSDVCIDDISPLVVSEGIYVCRFRPWTPCPGSVPGVEPGSGYVSLSVLLCRMTESGGEVARRLDFQEQRVDVRVPPSISSDVQ